MRKSNRRAWLMLGMLAVIAAGGCSANKDDESKAAYQIETATIGPIEDTVEATGEVTPLNRVEIKPPMAGRIEQLLIHEGSSVREGQTLAWMSSSDRVAILDAARSQGTKKFNRMKALYKPTPIISPLTGTVILKNVVAGQSAEPSTVLYAISDKLIVLAMVDEVDIARVKRGMEARITLDAYPKANIVGKVFDLLHEGQNVSNVITYGVKIMPLGDLSIFRSQMTTNVSLVVSRKEKAVLVPSSAVSASPTGGRQVLVPGPAGEPLPHPVETGLDNGKQIEILSGLKPGDSVVIASKPYLRQKREGTSPLLVSGQRKSKLEAKGD